MANTGLECECTRSCSGCSSSRDTRGMPSSVGRDVAVITIQWQDYFCADARRDIPVEALGAEITLVTRTLIKACRARVAESGSPNAQWDRLVNGVGRAAKSRVVLILGDDSGRTGRPSLCRSPDGCCNGAGWWDRRYSCLGETRNGR